MTQCFNCSQNAEYTDGLIKVLSKEENKDKREIIDGKIDPTYETKERWFCLKCIARKGDLS